MVSAWELTIKISIDKLRFPGDAAPPLNVRITVSERQYWLAEILTFK